MNIVNVDNEFSAQMKKVSVIKLEEIIANGGNYNPLAVEAAKLELENRKNSTNTNLLNSQKSQVDITNSHLATFCLILNVWSYVFLLSFVVSIYNTIKNSLSGFDNQIIDLTICGSLAFSFCVTKFLYHLGKK